MLVAVVYPSGTAAQNAEPEIVRAQPRGSQDWVTADDFTPGLRDLGVEGRVGFLLHVNPSGHVERCIVTQSSGSVRLDARTCELVSQRARFDPPKNRLGNSSTATFEGGVNWALSKPSNNKTPRMNYSMEVTVDDKGRVTKCDVVDFGMTLAPGTSSRPFDPCPKVGSLFEDDFVSRESRDTMRFLITKAVIEIP